MDDNIKSTVDGVRAVELFFRAIREISTGDAVFFRSQVRLNAPSMGTLLPERYTAVIESSDRCIAIFKLALTQLLQSIKKFDERGVEFEWISIYMPVRFLRLGSSLPDLENICRDCNVSPEKICFEISPRLFEEDGQACAMNMKALRNKGFRFMLTNFGDRLFSVLKIADYLPDYLMLPPLVASGVLRSERRRTCAKALAALAEELNAELIADDVYADEQFEAMKEIGCLYYTGPLAGNFMAERYLRAKNDDKGGEK